MKMHTFADAYFPYCIERASNSDTWVVYSREHKPLGIITDKIVKNGEYPTEVKFLNITAELAEQLSIDGSNDINSIQLMRSNFHAESDPDEYFKKLKLLSDLKISYKSHP